MSQVTFYFGNEKRQGKLDPVTYPASEHLIDSLSDDNLCEFFGHCIENLVYTERVYT